MLNKVFSDEALVWEKRGIYHLVDRIKDVSAIFNQQVYPNDLGN